MFKKLIGAVVGRASKRFVLAVAVALAVLGIDVNPVGATLLTFSYQGIVTSTTDQTGQLGTEGITAGTTFSGEFVYDTDALSNFTFAGGADYLGISLTVDFDTGTAVSSTGSNIQIYDGNSTFNDGFNVISNPSSSAQLSYDSSFVFQVILLDSSALVYSSVALPTSLTLSDFDSLRLLFFGFDTLGDDRITGTITSLTLAVPEPSTLALFGIGLAGLGFMRRRRKRRQPVQATLVLGGGRDV